MATLTVQPVPGSLPPRVDLTLSWPATTTVTIRRRDPDGIARPVRGAEPAVLSSGAWSGSDYESWFDFGHIYEATSAAGSLITSAESVLSPEAVWLRHPGQPGKSVAIDLAAGDDSVRAIGRAVLQPLGRNSPIVVTDGVRRQPTTTYKLRTWDAASRDALLSILSDGAVLLLDVPDNWGWGVSHQYIAVGDVAETRLVEDDATFWGREWSLPVDVVERQAGALAALINYGSVMEGVSTFQEWRELYSTYATLLGGNATGGNTPPPSGGGGGGETIVNTGGSFSASTWGSNPADYSQATIRTNDMAPPVYVVLSDLRANRLYTVTATWTGNITGASLSPSATSVTGKIVRASGGVWVNFGSAAKVTISQTVTPGTATTFTLSGTMTIPSDGTYLVGLTPVITGGTQFRDATDGSHTRSVVVTDQYYASNGASGTNTSGDINIETTGGGGGGGGGGLPALSTYSALYSAYSTYNALLTARSTYTIVLNGT